MALPIGGFMPIPLAMMIPFMATQSMVMGDAFGRAFQYGKRKISAMSNEEFNATSIEEQAANMFKSYKLIIPKLNDAIDDSSALQRKIINEMLLILPKFVSETGTQIFSPGGTNIKTEIEEHQHSIDRPHLHSGTKTIIGTTTTNGITTTHYSDGTTTTSGFTDNKILTYSYFHKTSPSIGKNVSVKTTNHPKAIHKKEIYSIWAQYKNATTGHIKSNHANKAIAYKTAYEVAYQEFLLPPLN